jgi:hypothetical protein
MERAQVIGLGGKHVNKRRVFNIENSALEVTMRTLNKKVWKYIFEV